MTKVVITQTRELQNFYSHADQYAADIAEGKQAPQTYRAPESLQKLSRFSPFGN